MGSSLRFVVGDCKLRTPDAVKRLSLCMPSRRIHNNLSFGDEMMLSEKARSFSIQGKSQTPVAAAAAAALLHAPLISHNSRRSGILCNATAGAAGNVPDIPSTEPSQYEKIIETLTILFPLWVIIGTIIGIYKPSAVTWLETDLFTVGLGFLMLSMGLTLTFEDFRRCL